MTLIGREALERIIKRAAELQAGAQDVGDGLTHDEVVALGKDVGIPSRYVHKFTKRQKIGKETLQKYVTLFEQKAQEKKIQEAILDQGLYPTRQGTVTFSVLKGLIDSGLKIPHDAKIFPREDRIRGKHISEEMVKQVDTVKANIQKVK